jgi:hypothetical protein
MEKILVTTELGVLADPDNQLEKVVVSEQEVVVVSSDTSSVVVTGIMGPPGASSIADMVDVDKSQLTDGAVLVYVASTSTWKATNKLDNQILEAGQF